MPCLVVHLKHSRHKLQKVVVQHSSTEEEGRGLLLAPKAPLLLLSDHLARKNLYILHVNRREGGEGGEITRRCGKSHLYTQKDGEEYKCAATTTTHAHLAGFYSQPMFAVLPVPSLIGTLPTILLQRLETTPPAPVHSAHL